jgi:hypothetical protein
MAVKKPQQATGSNDRRPNGKAWKKYIWVASEGKKRKRLIRVKNPNK